MADLLLLYHNLVFGTEFGVEWLCFVDIEGFGPTGPYAKRGGFDNIAIAIGGLMNITGPEVGLGLSL